MKALWIHWILEKTKTEINAKTKARKTTYKTKINSTSLLSAFKFREGGKTRQHAECLSTTCRERLQWQWPSATGVGCVPVLFPAVKDEDAEASTPLVMYECGTTTYSVHLLNSFFRSHPCYPSSFMCRSQECRQENLSTRMHLSRNSQKLKLRNMLRTEACDRFVKCSMLTHLLWHHCVTKNQIKPWQNKTKRVNILISCSVKYTESMREMRYHAICISTVVTRSF